MDKNQLEELSNQNQYELQQISKMNDKTQKFGLALSTQEMKDLVVKQKETLHEQKRIEFGEGIMPNLIFAFCDSDFISQSNYYETMSKLQEIFYYYKNDLLDEVSDDELISCMREAFEGECKGSLEHLEDTILEKYARKIRTDRNSYKSHCGSIEYDEKKIPYTPEELYSVAVPLFKKYTSNESTSIPVETAEQLMSAVIYCIELMQQRNEFAIVNTNRIPINEAYKIGYEILIDKIKETQKKYNEMILGFNAFGNINYNYTVTKAIPGFFRYYDPKFAPQDTIISMDYPTIIPIRGCQGINAIAKYVEYITLEQQFLETFSEDYIIKILSHFQQDYRDQFYNICTIIERYVLVRMFMFEELGDRNENIDYKSLKNIIEKYDQTQLGDRFMNLLEEIVIEKYENNQAMLEYLGYDCKDFIVELFNAAKYNQLQRIV